MNRILMLTTAVLLLAGRIEVHPADQETQPNQVQHFVAVDNVCAWPNLTLMRDGTVLAILHNQPSHGQQEGDVDCWASLDGRNWRKRSTVSRHQPNTIRMNHAAGLARNGDLIVLCSGWTNVKQPQRPKQAPFRDAVLRAWVLRSSDGGRTWEKRDAFPAAELGWTEHIPFGDIWNGDDGGLHASCYQGELKDPEKSSKTKGWRSWHFRSGDDGWTWKPVSIIGPRHNETNIFSLGGKSWLAAARIDRMELIRSDDNGATWGKPQPVTERNEINGHLTRLEDGRLLLSYGVRVRGRRGVCAKLSNDNGRTWSEPIRLAHTVGDADCGYPSSVQLADGEIVTAWYSMQTLKHNGYQMGVSVWKVPARKERNRSATTSATATDKLWIDPRCKPLPFDLLGPFVRLDRSVLAIDSEATFVSQDAGQTWSDARPLFDKSHNIKVSNERAMLRTGSGVIIAAFMNLNERNWTWKNDLHDAPGAKLPTYVMRSLDDGRTWQDIQKMHDDWTGAVRDMIQTRDGRVIFTAMKMRHDPGRHSVLTYSSTDDGKTWKASNLIDLGGRGHHGGVTEPTLTELKGGRLWMLIRTNWGEFWSGFSHDGGRFWRVIQPSGIAASSAPGLLKRLSSGQMMLAWNRPLPEGKGTWPLSGGDGLWSDAAVSNHREELSLAFSSDDGKTWTEPTVVARQRGKWLAYPYAFEYKPGEIWLTTMQGSVRVNIREEDFVSNR